MTHFKQIWQPFVSAFILWAVAPLGVQGASDIDAKSPGGEETSGIEVFRLQHRNPQEISEILEILKNYELVDGNVAVRKANSSTSLRVVVHSPSRSLIVRAPKEALEWSAKVVAVFDSGAAPGPPLKDVGLFNLRFVDAKGIRETIRQLGYKARTFNGPTQNSLIVWAPEEILKEISTIVKALDIECNRSEK